jgi:hypothetical protein
VTDYRVLQAKIFVGCSNGAVNAAAIVSQPERDLPAAVSYLENMWLTQFAANPGRCQEAAIRIRGDPASIGMPSA